MDDAKIMEGQAPLDDDGWEAHESPAPEEEPPWDLNRDIGASPDTVRRRALEKLFEEVNARGPSREEQRRISDRLRELVASEAEAENKWRRMHGMEAVDVGVDPEPWMVAAMINKFYTVRLIERPGDGEAESIFAHGRFEVVFEGGGEAAEGPDEGGDGATDPGGALLGVYMDGGPRRGTYDVSPDVMEGLIYGFAQGMKAADRKEAVAALRHMAERVAACEDPDYIPVENGIVDYRTKELLDFDPDVVLLSKCRTRYREDASKPLIRRRDGTLFDVDEWMPDLFGGDGERELAAWQTIGASVRPFVRWNKAVFFISERGNSGKGTLCDLMAALVGRDHCAFMNLIDLAREFKPGGLPRVQLVIGHENPVNVRHEAVDVLKGMTTNDEVTINVKYKDPISFRFRGLVVQCLNDYPIFADETGSFARRQLFLPFDRCFNGVEDPDIRDSFLVCREMLEYVLYKVINLPSYYEIYEGEACLAEKEQAASGAGAMGLFWSEIGPRLAWGVVPLTFLYDLYLAWERRRKGDRASCVPQKVFEQGMTRAIGEDAGWLYLEGLKRVTAGSMDAEEPLIEEYAVPGWGEGDIRPSYRKVLMRIAGR